MNSDKITTIFGAVVAAATAAQPAFNAVQGSFHSDDYFKLAIAVATAVWGYFTNKEKKA